MRYFYVTTQITVPDDSMNAAQLFAALKDDPGVRGDLEVLQVAEITKEQYEQE